jgi:hypothetical protein
LEEVIAASPIKSVELKDWEQDQTPTNQYDGDIWLNF